MVMRSGKRVVLDTIQCIYTKQKDLGVWRCAIVIPTGVDKRAVVRNRMRRCISESLRVHVSPIPDGVDMVFLVKKGFPTEQRDVNEKLLALVGRIV